MKGKEEVKKIQRGELVPLVVYVPREMHRALTDASFSLSREVGYRVTMSQVVRASIAAAIANGLSEDELRKHLAKEVSSGGSSKM